MPALERIVRPFQEQSPFAKATVSVSTGDPVDPVVVKFGDDAAEPKTLSGSYSSSTSYYCDQKQTNKPNSSNIRRVESSQDSSTYVDVEEFKKSTSKGGSGKGYQKTKVKSDTSGTESDKAKVVGTRDYGGGE